jgi:hypothetical protein
MLTDKQKVFVMQKVCCQMYNKSKLSDLLNKCKNRDFNTSIVDIVREFTKDDMVTENGVYLFAGAIEALDFINEKDFKFFGVI